MSWRLRLSVETILRLTPAVLGSTVTQPPTRSRSAGRVVDTAPT